jgi:hypothetical protein
VSICRSCRARITWLETAGGKKIPVDEDPVPDGNIVVVGGMAHVLGKHDVSELAFTEPRYKSHFVTCPQAREWRNRASS